jgi:hypothetical protein
MKKRDGSLVGETFLKPGESYEVILVSLDSHRFCYYALVKTTP